MAKSLAKSKEEKERIDQIVKEHISGKKVMVDFKKMLTKIVQDFLIQFQEKRKKIIRERDYFHFLLTEGKKIAQENANETLEAMRKVLSF